MKPIVLALMLVCGWGCASERADLVVVEKAKHQLSVYGKGRLLASFHAVFGSHPDGTKAMEGDGRTPEGRYLLDAKKLDSAFYKAFHVSYPGPQDVERARMAGVSPGKDIMVHGQKNGLGWLAFISQRFNWTQGCIALTNEDMDALWSLVDVGTPIEIRP